MLEDAAGEGLKMDPVQRELLEVTWKMINAINTGDAETYASLSSDDLTCFEDVCAYRIDGVKFHVDLIRLMAREPGNRPTRFDLLTPHVQVYPNTGIVTYTRLMTYDEGGKPRWSTFNETRVFVRHGESWKMVHFHRSPT